MGLFIMTVISIIIFFMLKASLGAAIAAIISFFVFIAIYIFNRYSSTTGLIKSNMRVYFLNRSRGIPHDESLDRVIRSRPRMYREDIIKMSGKTNITIMDDTEKKELKNLIYLIFCYENGVPPTEKWRENIYEKMNTIYKLFSKKYNIESKETKYKKMLKDSEVLVFMKSILDLYDKYRNMGHDLAIEKTVEEFYHPETDIAGDIMARFESLNVLVSSVGGFKKTCYGENVDSIEGPLKGFVKKGREIREGKGNRYIKVLAENLKDTDFIERDIKILIFVMYDYKCPFNACEEIYGKRIRQINKVYELLTQKN